MWHQLMPPWQACIEQAWMAYCHGSVPIGAVITDAEGQIIARGRNRIGDRHGALGRVHGSRVAHAEIDALAHLDADYPDPRSAVVYSTMEPCPMCIGAIRMCLIGHVRYAARDAMAGSAAFVTASPFMQRRPIQVVGPDRFDLEAVLIGLHVEWLLHLSPPPLHVSDSWKADSPAGVKLGETLFERNIVPPLAQAHASAKYVVDTCVQLLGSM